TDPGACLLKTRPYKAGCLPSWRKARPGVFAGSGARAGEVAGGGGVRSVVEEDPVVHVHPRVVGRVHATAREEIADRPERRFAVDSQPVLERQLRQRRRRTPDASSLRLRLDLGGAILLETIRVGPDHVEHGLSEPQLFAVEVEAVASDRMA